MIDVPAPPSFSSRLRAFARPLPLPLSVYLLSCEGNDEFFSELLEQHGLVDKFGCLDDHW